MNPDRADRVIQHIGDELDEVTRDLSFSGSHNPPPTSAPKSRLPSPPRRLPVKPTRAVSPVSRASSDNDDDPSRQFLNALRPLKNPDISPVSSPRLTVETPTSDVDSPTLPPGQGLSLLVRQHLRSDSGASSVYAGSSYTRMSRVSRYGSSQSAAKPSVGPRASGSSGGNMWPYDDFGRQNPDDEPPSPSSTFPPPNPRNPHKSSSSSSRGSPEEPEDDRDGDRSTYPEPYSSSAAVGGGRGQEKGGYSADEDRRVESGRMYGRRDRDDVEPRDVRWMEEGRDERRAEETIERRGRRRAESKASAQDGSRQGDSRGASRAGTERSLSRAGSEDNQDRDWAEELAFRRHLVQQNLRNQGTIQSHHEGDNRDLPGGRVGRLRAKGSNGVLRNDGGRPQIIMGPNGPMRADGGGWKGGIWRRARLRWWGAADYSRPPPPPYGRRPLRRAARTPWAPRTSWAPISQRPPSTTTTTAKAKAPSDHHQHIWWSGRVCGARRSAEEVAIGWVTSSSKTIARADGRKHQCRKHAERTDNGVAGQLGSRAKFAESAHNTPPSARTPSPGGQAIPAATFWGWIPRRPLESDDDGPVRRRCRARDEAATATNGSQPGAAIREC